MSFVYAIILTFFTGFVQVAFGVKVFIFTLDLLLILLAYASRYLEPEQTIILGALSGLIIDAFSPDFFGATIAARATSAYFFSIFFHLLLVEKPIQSGLAIGGGSLLNSLIYTCLTPYIKRFPYMFLTKILPDSCFMFFVGFIFFLLRKVEFRLSRKLYAR